MTQDDYEKIEEKYKHKGLGIIRRGLENLKWLLDNIEVGGGYTTITISILKKRYDY